MDSLFGKDPDVVVGDELPMIHDLREPTGRTEPDVLVALGLERRDRSSYKFSVEGKPPDFVLEVLSPTSRMRNRLHKKALYADLGIREYFLFQPNVERQEPRLVGYRLSGKEYVELGPDPAAGPDGALRSEVLGVFLRPEGERLRLSSLATGEDYLWVSEKDERFVLSTKKLAGAKERARREAKKRRSSDERARREAKKRRASDQRARREAKARVAEAERARREAKKRQASDERARREAKKRRASDERARREAKARHEAEERAAAADKRAASAEARAAKLEALLAETGMQPGEDN